MIEKILALMLVVTNVKRKYNGKDGKEWISCSDVNGDKYNQGVCIANTASVIHGRLSLGNYDKKYKKSGQKLLKVW